MRRRLLVGACFVYAGSVFGVSFVATPVKFLADVPMGDLLLVGRETFGAFAFVEYAMAAAVVTLAMMTRCVRAYAWVVAGLVVAMHLGLRPVLDRRLLVAVDSGEADPTRLHHVYAVLELAKLIVLVRAGWVAAGTMRG